MSEIRSHLIVSAIAAVPYLGVAWLFAELGGVHFWVALGVLLAARLFFAAVEWVGGILVWRFYGRKHMVQRNLLMLRSNKFPPPAPGSRDALSYLSQLQDDPNASPQVRNAAKEMRFVLATFENLGALRGMRMHSAADEAVQRYSQENGVRAA